MNILARLLDVIAPDECVGCGEVGSALCDNCQLETWHACCHVCKKPSTYSLPCPKCKRKTSMSALYVASPYVFAAKKLVKTMKYQPLRTVCPVMARSIRGTLPYIEDLVIVPVPTTNTRRRQRGFDQSVEIAKSLRALCGAELVVCLERVGTARQVGATKKERIEHMAGAFECHKPQMIKDRIVLLVDDVYTTGATLEAAAKLVKQAGAKKVLGAVFARAV